MKIKNVYRLGKITKVKCADYWMDFEGKSSIYNCFLERCLGLFWDSLRVRVSCLDT
ncbi:hypothetical protein [Pedobacter frigoris]|uniref:hypothetical protein n=1 Tax=Pedobacter frigoris TaxID=2571272 RepID=UPI00292CEFF4|nr:hypothetical protein [Pedobacter frigoris]